MRHVLLHLEDEEHKRLTDYKTEKGITWNQLLLRGMMEGKIEE